VIGRIVSSGCGDFIRHTRSCTRVRDMTTLHPHCGQCSQCIDRRFAILAAGQEHDDPAEAYKVDLFTGARSEGPDREMALAYVRSASEVDRMADEAFFARFGEVSRVVGYFPEPAEVVATRVLELHRRHASSVCGVFDQAVASHASALREGTLASGSLLVLKVSRVEGGQTVPQPPSRNCRCRHARRFGWLLTELQGALFSSAGVRSKVPALKYCRSYLRSSSKRPRRSWRPSTTLSSQAEFLPAGWRATRTRP
jgi:hypothetical protein